MNNKSRDVEVADLPVAEPLVFATQETIEKESLVGKADNKSEEKTFGFKVPIAQGVTQGQSSDSGGYWGRFDDPHASSVTVLPAGAMDVDDDNIPVATARLDDRKIRHQFIRKVYTILSVQLLVTFACSALITLHIPTRNFVLGSGMPLYWTNSVMMLVLICALSAYKRSYPTNYILLSLFTLSSSYIVGTVTAMYSSSGAGDLVLEAVLITASVFIILTIYTLQSKWDFSFMGAGLGMGLWVMILWGLFAIIFGAQAGWVYALMGSLLFSGFIIYDTYMLAERHDPQDYVIAAIELYLDLINLFLYILRLLGEANRR